MRQVEWVAGHMHVHPSGPRYSSVSARTYRFSKDSGVPDPLRGALARHSVDLRSPDFARVACRGKYMESPAERRRPELSIARLWLFTTLNPIEALNPKPPTKPDTLNPKPQNPKPETLNLKP